MYANFVVSGSAQDVYVGGDIQTQVLKELEPPFEELFDAVEEHVLQSLLEPWNTLIAQEKNQYKDQVRITEFTIIRKIPKHPSFWRATVFVNTVKK